MTYNILKYRDNMTSEEIRQLLDECAKIDAIPANDPPAHKIEGSLAEFNRYIAGDRK